MTEGTAQPGSLGTPQDSAALDAYSRLAGEAEGRTHRVCLPSWLS